METDGNVIVLFHSYHMGLEPSAFGLTYITDYDHISKTGVLSVGEIDLLKDEQRMDSDIDEASETIGTAVNSR